MNDQIQDRRESGRRHLLYYLDVIDESTGELLGQLGDITPDGLLVISSQPLGMEEERNLRVKLPRVREFSNADLVVRVAPCWKSPDVNPDLFCSGFQFVDPDDGVRNNVEQLIRILGFRD